MREILFRGKREYDGKWVLGSLHIEDGETDKNGNKSIDYRILGMRGECDYVIPETVGQFTGLTTNGKKIFEGDIGRYKQTDGAKLSGKQITCIGKVVYNTKTASFAVDSKDELGVKNYDYFPIKDLEVIGNIHDNPELVEG